MSGGLFLWDFIVMISKAKVVFPTGIQESKEDTPDAGTLTDFI